MISPRTLHADPGALVATPPHQTLLRFDNPEIGSDAAIGLGRLATQEKLGAQHRLPDPDRRSGLAPTLARVKPQTLPSASRPGGVDRGGAGPRLPRRQPPLVGPTPC